MPDAWSAKEFAVKELKAASIPFEESQDSVDAFELYGSLADSGGAMHMTGVLLALSRKLVEKGFCAISWGIDAERWYIRMQRDF